MTVAFGRSDPSNDQPGRGGDRLASAAAGATEATEATEVWPEAPGPAAYHGLAGRAVALIDPHTEADPVAVLLQFLVAFGSAVGSGPHALVGATRHGTNLFGTIVGDTAKARKGDSWTPVLRLYERADPAWRMQRISSGFGSGEAVIWAVRDAQLRWEPSRRGGSPEYQQVQIDPGETDKRLLVVEPEFARILRVAGRQGNTLSMTVRDAWDRGDLRSMTKGASLTATGAHVSVIAHITAEELAHELATTETVNGFINRFILALARRSKLLPEPEPLPEPAVAEITRDLAHATAFARACGVVVRSPEARALWADVYPLLSRGEPGLVGSVLARAEAHVLRLSVVYALLDRSDVVRPEHLLAALEVWGYGERSVRHLFGGLIGDPLADRIDRALMNGPLTRTEIRDVLGRHASQANVTLALERLRTTGIARVEAVATGGRSAEVWRHA